MRCCCGRIAGAGAGALGGALDRLARRALDRLARRAVGRHALDRRARRPTRSTCTRPTSSASNTLDVHSSDARPDSLTCATRFVRSPGLASSSSSTCSRPVGVDASRCDHVARPSKYFLTRRVARSSGADFLEQDMMIIKDLDSLDSEVDLVQWAGRQTRWVVLGRRSRALARARSHSRSFALALARARSHSRSLELVRSSVR